MTGSSTHQCIGGNRVAGTGVDECVHGVLQLVRINFTKCTARLKVYEIEPQGVATFWAPDKKAGVRCMALGTIYFF